MEDGLSYEEQIRRDLAGTPTHELEERVHYLKENQLNFQGDSDPDVADLNRRYEIHLRIGSEELGKRIPNN